ncbi:MAG: CcmD family protein [Deltaproteobacteria bacterium]|nr:CcmD family protein [Deltaproteobacteria bacterium]
METPNTFPDMFLAFSALWTIICIYLFTLSRKVSKLQKEKNND